MKRKACVNRLSRGILGQAVLLSGKQDMDAARNARFETWRCFSYGGVERIRTSAPVTQPNDLANRPLKPLEYHSAMKLDGRGSKT